ncbi:succinylglutamate desuccinylase [Modicisalibacter ilicicola DSM 19980]|uniref:Succinylglutamate desuccinylase n=1 Tax=Modicisalibacter ilicicola DSM 19980 TaxID=1121942 RepID=A0A1M4TDR7_9GAMM|nr:succinylglutamate desuccinylase [Halomonas ilicicola]SHE42689.1 succinylglutamate desuccinylase [Halomonas ilicicola DSM 19980]
MLSDWLNLTLDGSESGAREGRLASGRYVIHRPGILELVPQESRSHANACVISAGIHGNETAPIELVGDLLARLEAGLLAIGAPVLIILGNLPAIRTGQRFCTTNLNRLFRRDLAEEGDEPQRARELMATVDAFYGRHPQPRLHYDLHTAIRDSRYPRFAVEPFGDTATRPEQWRWLAAADIQAVLHQHQHSWTFSHYSKHYHQAQAFTLELGKVRAFGDNDLATLQPMRALLEALIAGTEPPATDPGNMIFFRVAHELMRESEDFALCVPDETPNFTRFEVGTRLARDGKAGDCIVSDAPLAVVFPNANVEIGARAALLARETRPPDD